MTTTIPHQGKHVRYILIICMYVYAAAMRAMCAISR